MKVLKGITINTFNRKNVVKCVGAIYQLPINTFYRNIQIGDKLNGVVINNIFYPICLFNLDDGTEMLGYVDGSNPNNSIRIIWVFGVNIHQLHLHSNFCRKGETLEIDRDKIVKMFYIN